MNTKRITLIAFILVAIIAISISVSRNIEPKKAFQFQASLNNTKIFFDPDTLTRLQQFYMNSSIEDFKLCLTGFTKEEDTVISYYITSFYRPELLFNSAFYLHQDLCNETTVIDLHANALHLCTESERVRFSYGMYQRYNHTIIAGVMCAEDRFSFYAVQ